MSTVGSQDHRSPQLQLNADAKQDLAKLSVLREQSLLRFMFLPHCKFQTRCQEWCLEHSLAGRVLPPTPSLPDLVFTFLPLPAPVSQGRSLAME